VDFTLIISAKCSQQNARDDIDVVTHASVISYLCSLGSKSRTLHASLNTPPTAICAAKPPRKPQKHVKAQTDSPLLDSFRQRIHTIDCLSVERIHCLHILCENLVAQKVELLRVEGDAVEGDGVADSFMGWYGDEGHVQDGGVWMSGRGES